MKYKIQLLGKQGWRNSYCSGIINERGRVTEYYDCKATADLVRASLYNQELSRVVEVEMP